MRADRLVSTLLLLQQRGRMTARELATELEVSERTVLRDMDALSAAGVPVVSARGNNGGWSLVEGYRTELTGLKEAEARALFVGAPAKVLADLQLDDANRAALLKLRNAIPNASDSARLVHVDLAGWRNSRDPVPFLPMIQDALFRARRIRIDYTRGVREVDPLGLVAKGQLWYLVALFEGEPRTYRISRINGVEVLDQTAQRPPNFDLAEYWRTSMQTFTERLPRVDVIALVDRDALQRVETFLRYGAVDRVDDYDETRVRVELHFDALDAAAASLACAGVEVLEPVELRERIRSAALATAAMYANL
jgi:predicted DNA-binding transcriptional regulator YafY